uniref:NADH-ubiquinone oxidoreductase chain 6 n=1 Tax=Iconaster longimanus TaxID=2672156 RepID=A0A7S8HPV9_9ECHI|nr:NADH dehydrogenase subunit 6 [Iconaster longimanus]QPC56405.1 NADH dehydrogenase subunit 6 [Iconaster longimanus]
MIFYSVLTLMFFGSTLVFYSLSPYYGALGLVLVAVSGCIFCSLVGFSFIALVLVLIYIGGMLVVFVYSTAISAERYPVVSNFKEVFLLGGLVVVWGMLNFDSFCDLGVGSFWSSFSSVDMLGSGNLYLGMWVYFLVGGYVLLVALIVALVVTYGADYSVLKAL